MGLQTGGKFGRRSRDRARAWTLQGPEELEVDALDVDGFGCGGEVVFTSIRLAVVSRLA